MSVLDSVAVAAAERLERSVGPTVALHAFKVLLAGTERALLLRAASGALRCALALRDELELAALAAYWETLIGVDAGDAIPGLVVPLLVDGRAADAVTIAAADVERLPTARSAYLLARALEAAGRPHEEAFARCAELATDDTEADLRSAARSKQLEALISRQAPATEQLEVAEQIDVRAATAPQKLLAAEVRLHAPSRFARAAALSVLEELAADDDSAIACAAMRLAALHADHMARDLSWVEADRVGAALAFWPAPDERATALACLSARRRIASEDDPDAVIAEAVNLAPDYRLHLERARATIAGYHVASESPPLDRELLLADLCLQAISEISLRQWRDAELTMRDLLKELGDDARLVPYATWTVARFAVSAREARNVSLSGLELVALLLKVAPALPPTGLLPYAAAAHQWRAGNLTEALLRRAEQRNEPGARALLVAHLTRRVRHDMATEDRGQRLSVLREAKALAES